MAMMDQAKQGLDQAKQSINKFASDVTRNESLREGNLTQTVEQQTARIPSLGYMGLAVGSMIASALITVFAERKEYGNFVGLWAPSFLMMGIYNKLVKLEGSDQFNKKANQSKAA